MQQSIQQFLDSGDGPLAGIVQQFQEQGLDANEARDRSRTLLQHAQGVLVVLLASDQGLTAMPQMFYGVLNEEYQSAIVNNFRDDFPHKEDVQSALKQLEARIVDGASGTTLFIAHDGEDDPEHFWSEIAEEIVRGIDEGIFPQKPEQLAELGYWVASAMRSLVTAGTELSGDDLLYEMRCWLLASDLSSAEQAGGELLREYEPEDEELLKALEQFSVTAIRSREPQRVRAFFDTYADGIDDVLGGIYELELARFRAVAASAPGVEELQDAAERLQKSDKRSFRHTLNKEPLWVVTTEAPGELIDTAEAADRIERSITFVAKRLESATIPIYHDGDEIKIPAAALMAWKQVMDHFQLLD